jgi:hypothetical protein
MEVSIFEYCSEIARRKIEEHILGDALLYELLPFASVGDALTFNAKYLAS